MLCVEDNSNWVCFSKMNCCGVRGYNDYAQLLIPGSCAQKNATGVPVSDVNNLLFLTLSNLKV